MFRKLCIIVLLGFICVDGFSQQGRYHYRHSAGLRLGTPVGFTYRQVVAQGMAMELMAGQRWGGVVLTGMLQKQYFPWRARYLGWYWGFGGHVGFHSNTPPPWAEGHSEFNGTDIGADIMIGFEHKFKTIPITITLDWKPTYNIIGRAGLDNGALSIRYYW